MGYRAPERNSIGNTTKFITPAKFSIERIPAASNTPSEPVARLESTMPTRASSAPSQVGRDRKSTRLNSSHSQISYAVFCLKKKKTKQSELIRSPPDSYTANAHLQITRALQQDRSRI